MAELYGESSTPTAQIPQARQLDPTDTTVNQLPLQNIPNQVDKQEHESLSSDQDRRRFCLEWDHNKILSYRSDGLICSGVGTLPQTPQQSSFLGAPFVVPRHCKVDLSQQSPRDKQNQRKRRRTTRSYDSVEPVGSHIQEVGSQIKEVGSHIQEVGFQIKEVGSHIQEVGSQIKEVGSHIQEVGFQIKAAGQCQSPRSASYQALRSKGLTVVDGLKYGVDWLVYPDSSLSVHAQSLVSSVPSSASISPIDLVSLNRMAEAVNKSALLAVHFNGSLCSSSNNSPIGLLSQSAIQTCQSLIPATASVALIDIERIKDV